MKSVKNWASAAALAVLSGTSQASLVSQGNGTVLDTTTNLIWLTDWDVNGRQNWATQKAWAENLAFAGSSDWVLPSITDYTTLFAEVGNLTTVSAFTNVQPGVYWSGTEDRPGFDAWFLLPGSGLQFGGSEGVRLFAVAVHPGAVAATVPAPQTLALALLALGAALVAGRRRAD